MTEIWHAGEEVNEQTPGRHFNLDLEEEDQIFFRDIDTNEEKEDQVEVSTVEPLYNVHHWGMRFWPL